MIQCRWLFVFPISSVEGVMRYGKMMQCVSPRDRYTLGISKDNAQLLIADMRRYQVLAEQLYRSFQPIDICTFANATFLARIGCVDVYVKY